MVDNEEIELIANAVAKQLSKEVYNMLCSFSWFLVEAIDADEFGSASIPTYADAIRD